MRKGCGLRDRGCVLLLFPLGGISQLVSGICAEKKCIEDRSAVVHLLIPTMAGILQEEW